MARSRASTLVVSAALALGALSASGCSRVRDGVSDRASDAVSAQPAAPRVIPDPHSEKLTLQLADGIDGDTIRVLDADGRKLSIRLIGIDAPESNKVRYGYAEMFGKESKAHMAELLRGVGEVVLEFDATQDKADRYGRPLCYAWLPDGSCLNYRMLAEGYVWEFTFHVPYRLQGAFRKAQDDARRENRGLWAPEPEGCGGVRKPVPGSVLPKKPARKR